MTKPLLEGELFQNALGHLGFDYAIVLPCETIGLENFGSVKRELGQGSGFPSLKCEVPF